MCRFTEMARCEKCQGGALPFFPYPCPECQGSGIVSCCDTAGASEVDYSIEPEVIESAVASANGRVIKSICKISSGDGRRAWEAKMTDGTREIIVELREA